MPLEAFLYLVVRLAADCPGLPDLLRRGLVAKHRLHGPLFYWQLTAKGCGELGVSVHRSRPMGSVALHYWLMLLAYAEYQDDKHEVREGFTTWKDQVRKIIVPGPFSPISSGGIVRTLRTHIREIVEEDGERLEMCRARTLGFIVLLANQTKAKALDRFLTDEGILKRIAPIRAEYVRTPNSWGLTSRPSGETSHS